MDPERKWPVQLAFSLVVAVGVAAVARDWQWALIASGGMVVVLALAVGTDLSKWALSAGKDGVSMSAERVARQEMEKAAGILASGTVEGRVTESVGGPGISDADMEEHRRDQIVRLMTTAAQWGWLQGKAGVFQTAPHPVVIWDGDRPQILYGVAGGDIEGS
jgi:hypothetical protein